jgi:putative endonuclease
MSERYWVYILVSQSSGKTYAGQTDDLGRRVTEHNDKECYRTLYTKRNDGPWVVLWEESFKTRVEAVRGEKWWKTGVGREAIQRLKKEKRLELGFPLA